MSLSPMSHLQRLPPWSEGRAAYGFLRRFVRRRTPAITTSANSIRGRQEHCRKLVFRRCFWRKESILTRRNTAAM
jgi:hypothetical protein